VEGFIKSMIKVNKLWESLPPIDEIFSRPIIKHLRGHIANQKQKDRIGKLI